MSAAQYVILPERGVLAVGGPDRRGFLQGLVSNDVDKATAENAIHAALLTAQGRYLFDFFIVELGEALLLDTERARLPELKKKLTLYKLRSKVTLEDVSAAHQVVVAFGEGARERLDLPGTAGAARGFAGGVAFVDPRLAFLGARLILPAGTAAQACTDAGLQAGQEAEYDRLRLLLGVPDGTRDLPVEKALLLESGFDELHGVAWDKGCYMGQELTARTKYRGLVRKRLLPVEVEGALPAAGTPVMLGDKEAGEMRSGRDGRALALLRLELVAQARKAGTPLTAGAAVVKPHVPVWMTLPQAEDGEAEAAS